MKEYVIEKDILIHNIKVLKEKAKGVPICGIVKCNGYGMDLVPYAKLLLENGIDLPDDIITVDECVEELCKVLGEAK